MPARSLLKSAAFVALMSSAALPAVADANNAGAYLAARQALATSDFAAASTYFSKALARDPNNLGLMQDLIGAQIALGKIEATLPVAKLLVEKDPKNQIANMALLALAAKAGSFEDIVKGIDAGAGIGPLVDGLLSAWAEAGQGRMTEALSGFDKVAEAPGLKNFGLYHKALALMSVGDFEGADAIFSAGDLPPTRRGVIAHAEVLNQLERNDEAIKLIDDVFGALLDPGLANMRATLVEGGTLARTSVRTVQDGMAEVFFSVASALDGESDDAYALLYARLAEFLRPDHADAHLQTAVYLERVGQYDLAVEAYRAVPRDDAAFYAAEQGRADALRRSGREDAALEVLEQLTKTHGDIPAVHITLGDLFRAREEYEKAAASYDKAIALYTAPEANQWIVYFARGIAHERLKDWPDAEADFRKALELNPGQPQVLNYLGYSYLELKTNLDEALEMIQQAVAARPNDAYITDSLGWGYYLLGRYDDAVIEMEKAVQLMATDPIVNDHLGDVYWAVGRQREARVQWHRALSFEPEDKDATRIRRKLDVGLDVVLSEEGAEPLKVANGK